MGVTFSFEVDQLSSLRVRHFFEFLKGFFLPPFLKCCKCFLIQNKNIWGSPFCLKLIGLVVQELYAFFKVSKGRAAFLTPLFEILKTF